MPSFRTKVRLEPDLEIESFYEAESPEAAVAALVEYLKLEFSVPEETVIRIKYV
jgi:hypothetical protein